MENGLGQVHQKVPALLGGRGRVLGKGCSNDSFYLEDKVQHTATDKRKTRGEAGYASNETTL